MKISAIIPVLNEEKYINRCIRFLIKRLGNTLGEIIIVDGDETGSTLRFIKDYTPVKIKKITSKKGRGIQQNRGANFSENEILLFIHADSILPEDSKDLILKNIKDNVILSFSLGISDKKIFFKIIEFFSKIRCFLTNTPYGDQCYILTKKTFQKINGFPEENLEDVKFIKKARGKNIKIKIFSQKIKTSPRKWYKYGFMKNTIKNRVTILKFVLKNIDFLDY